ncbi:Hemolysin-type calcium-binding repeat-containing protein [Tranquillimonas rosea]|uniref:Hemolysin-type calcium-binding repeat-containing protein n=1 Tax=Tranquillimonas rosea TaxID=641238 RepID=A0A1H9WZ68_9RHOB|nr:calcium-binding protein [Tranquillimonas rosea]SES39134.1 Hemolysin-type calcium-binding repeat-containing protein [Tranquillimonas rosea]
MVQVNLSSELLDRIEFDPVLNDLLSGEGPDIALDYEDALADLDYLDDIELVGFSSSGLTVTGTSYRTGTDFLLELDATGLSPTSSPEALGRAIEAGTADGTLTGLTVTADGTEILSLDIDDDGYTLTSGTQRIVLEGALPADLSEFGDLVDAANAPNGEAALLAALEDYSLTTIVFEDAGREIAAVRSSSDGVSVALEGYRLTLDADQPLTLGALADLEDAADGDSPFALFDDLGAEGLRLTAPDGTVLISSTGTGPGTTYRLDGKEISEPGFAIGRYDGGSGDETIFSVDGGDAVFAGGGADMVYGRWGDDTLTGGWGDDTLRGGWGRDRIWGDDGDDQAYGDGGDDTLRGGDGDDTLYGGTQDDQVYGDAGNDVLGGAAGNDTVFGGAGDDTIYAGTGNDVIGGAEGDDEHWGGVGHDTVYGADGADEIGGGLGDDELWGGTGADSIYGADGDDRVGGGTGADELWGGSGNDTIYGVDSFDRIGGGAGDDELWGGDGADTLNGAEGDDALYGGAGVDVLNGGAGNDTLTGGQGTGADTFVFSAGGGEDRVTDFDAGEGDALRLDAGLWAGDLDADAVVTQFASVQDGAVVFAFDGGERLEIAGLDSTDGLADDIFLV